MSKNGKVEIKATFEKETKNFTKYDLRAGGFLGSLYVPKDERCEGASEVVVLIPDKK